MAPEQVGKAHGRFYVGWVLMDLAWRIRDECENVGVQAPYLSPRFGDCGP